MKQAIDSGLNSSFMDAYEAPFGTPRNTNFRVRSGFSSSATYYSQYTSPYEYTVESLARFPAATISFDVGYSQQGWRQISRTINAYSYSNYTNGKTTVLFRADGDFEIRDDSKFILDTSAAEWKGVEGAPYFVQLQISTYAASNTVFKICWHMFIPDVRRLSCTLHDRDTGAFRGPHIIDDSRGLGPVEYKPL